MTDPMLPLPGLSPVSGKSVMVRSTVVCYRQTLALSEVEQRFDDMPAAHPTPGPQAYSFRLPALLRLPQPKGQIEAGQIFAWHRHGSVDIIPSFLETVQNDPSFGQVDLLRGQRQAVRREPTL